MTLETRESELALIREVSPLDMSEIPDTFLADTELMHPPLTGPDLEYVQRNFVAQTPSQQARARLRAAPAASYTTPDGTPMVSRTPDRGLQDAKDAAELERMFTDRWTLAGGREDELDAELDSFLSGGYGVCLASPSPETILAKAGLAQAIGALTTQPAPNSAWWTATLRSTVSAYDALVLPFASVDAARFGGSTSRARLVDRVRERWPDLFAEPGRCGG